MATTLKCLLVWGSYRLTHDPASTVLMLDDSQVPALRPSNHPRGDWDRTLSEQDAAEVFTAWPGREDNKAMSFEGKILLLNFERMDAWTSLNAVGNAKRLVAAALSAGFAAVYWYGSFAKVNPGLMELVEGCMIPVNTPGAVLGDKDIPVLHPFEYGLAHGMKRVRDGDLDGRSAVLWGVTRNSGIGNCTMDTLIGYRQGFDDGLKATRTLVDRAALEGKETT